jgi:hypothetical protein
VAAVGAFVGGALVMGAAIVGAAVCAPEIPEAPSVGAAVGGGCTCATSVGGGRRNADLQITPAQTTMNMLAAIPA